MYFSICFINMLNALFDCDFEKDFNTIFSLLIHVVKCQILHYVLAEGSEF